jgi:hypothetical protein
MVIIYVMKLKYYNNRKIDIYLARTADRFSLLYTPVIDSEPIYNKFKTKIEKNRVYTLKTIYSDAFKYGSDYYDNLIYTRTDDDPGNGNIVATARIQSADYDFPNQGPTQDKTWRDRGGQHWGSEDLKKTAGNSSPKLSWDESYSEWVPESTGTAPQLPDKVEYAAIVPGYTILSVTVSLPASINLENNISIDGTRRVVEMPVFFYIQNGIFYNLDNSVMTGLPPAITTVPSAIPRSGTNVNPKETTTSQVSLRSYRFTTARYTLENGLWSAEWSQFDDAYVSEQLMKNVIYSGQAIL